MSTDNRRYSPLPARIEALRETGLLDSPCEEAFDRLTRLASRLLRVPVSLVTLVDEHRQFFKSATGLPEPWASARETPLTHSFCQHAVRSGEPLIIFDAHECPLVRKNLAIRDLGVVAYAGIPLKLPSGHTVGSFCAIDHVPRHWSVEEISTLKELARSAMTEIELKLALANQKDILATVSHDLKNPITAILLNCDLLRRQLPPSRAQVLVDCLERATRGMQNLVTRVLDRARIDYGLVEVELARVKVRDLFGSLADIFIPLAAARRVRLDIRQPDTETLVCDETRMGQILSNLTADAIEHSPEGGIVTVRMRIEPATGKTEISVSRTGAPIPAAHLPHLFERYWRPPEGMTRRRDELGLNIVARLVRAQDGEIRVTSTAESTTFTVQLSKQAGTSDHESPSAA